MALGYLVEVLRRRNVAGRADGDVCAAPHAPLLRVVAASRLLVSVSAVRSGHAADDENMLARRAADVVA